MMRDSGAGRARRAWAIGLCLYLLVGLAMNATAAILVPWVGTVFLLACASLHVERMKRDETVLMAAGAVELLLAVLIMFPAGHARWQEWGLITAFTVSALLPLATAVYVLVRLRTPKAPAASLAGRPVDDVAAGG